MNINGAIEWLSGFLWGFPALILIIGGGLFLSIRLKLPQLHIIHIFKRAGGVIFGKSVNGEKMSGMRTFSTALAAAVGTGSVAGVGAAMAVGGKGAVFWMWISALIGMGTSYCENYLGVRYCEKSGVTGAMAYLEKIGKGKILAAMYAFFTVAASLGMGNMVQSSTVARAAQEGFGLSKYAAAAGVVVFAALAVSGKSSAAGLCERLVPIMAAIFLLGSLAVIVTSPIKSLYALKDIVCDAFSPKAAAGGTFGMVCIEGIRRGAFSNEAGLGSAVSVHSQCGSGGKNPRENLGVMGMAEVFADTMIICTVTAVVIIVSGTQLTEDSAVNGYCAAMGGFGKYFISVSLILFALATIAGWYFVGEKAWRYIFGGSGLIYSLLAVICAYLGCMFNASAVWGISDIFNALMAVPNMIGVLLLSGEIAPPKWKANG